MRNSSKIIIISGVVVILIIIGIYFFYGQNQTGNLDEFAQCLADKNITMYGTPWCSWCQKQEALFGKSFRLVPYVDCSRDSQECVSRGIDGTPTWIFPDGSTGSPQGGKKIQSYLTLEQLSEESGCPLP